MSCPNCRDLYASLLIKEQQITAWQRRARDVRMLKNADRLTWGIWGFLAGAVLAWLWGG